LQSVNVWAIELTKVDRAEFYELKIILFDIFKALGPLLLGYL